MQWIHAWDKRRKVSFKTSNMTETAEKMARKTVDGFQKKKIGQENDSGRGRRRLFSEFIHWSPRPNCIEGLHANVDFTPTRLSLNHFSWSWWKWKKYKYHQKAAESPVTCSLRVNLYGVLVVPQCWGWNSWRHTARPQAAFPGQRL